MGIIVLRGGSWMDGRGMAKEAVDRLIRLSADRGRSNNK